ncbi:MAG: TRAP transporter large permease subunit [Limnobacter sp.]|nr:TRAP transporter large permease subunit [Limnobacter sp.]
MIPVEWLPPLMFAVLVLFMVSGFPVAFALAANGLLFGFVAIEQGLMSPALLQALPDRIFGIMSNDTLLAIPFFTFMGLILERSGMAEDLLDTIGQLFGRIRGGVAYAVVLVGALLAATTGVVAASVISMGLISLPVMLKYGYDKKVASGVIAASGTLAQIIPPSLVLIVMADQLSVSVGDMYTGALVPGLMLTGLYILYLFLVSVFNKNALPALPPEACHLTEANGKNGYASFFVVLALAVLSGFAAYVLASPQDGTTGDSALIAAISAGVGAALLLTAFNKVFKLGLLSRLTESVVFVLVPPLALIFLVLGTIYLGVATPTEGGAMGAVGAIVLAAFKKRLSWTLSKQALDATTKLSCFVMFILIGSTLFGLTFRAIDGDIWVEHLMGDLPGGELGFIIAVMVLVFILGCFLDFFEIAFIAVPLLVPVAQKLGIDMVWFGVMLGMMLQTSFLTPPFGFSLFYLKSVAPPAVKTSDIYKGSAAFIGLQLLMVVLVWAFPGMVLHDKAVKMDDSPLELQLETPGYGEEPQ